ncbi:hypothetical protein [Thalassospira indica]|uniref:Uncharacterized protein n=1 Tax=Thalassospira indica TaxID=1891279 RepID=A0ABM6XUW3_9PROT|nr:hypothetical protein [Thalassospira indica]AXO13423.1 hypothetical protein DY252_03760 [Thalassospira indica]OAZ14694.1 hypothetical protein TH15_02505 [Thalassospira profundimaris]
MVDFSALNPFRQGQSALQDARQPISKSNPDAGDSAAKARTDARNQVDPVALSDDALAAHNDSQKLAPSAGKSLSNKPLTTEELFERALDASLEMIRGSVQEMFALSGMSEEDAIAATDAMFNGIRDAASGQDQFEFSFDQAIASHSKTAISYAGANGAAVGVSESAIMAVQSLDISINNETGEFSFNYEAAKIEVVKTQAIAIGNSAGAALGALGAVMDGLGGGSLVDMLGNPASAENGGLLFDINDNGVAEFIRELMNATVGSDDASEEGDSAGAAQTNGQALAAERMAVLNAQITEQFMEQATLIVRSINQPSGETGEGAGPLQLTVDMMMPMGLFGQDDGKATFTFPNGETVPVTDPTQEQDVLI